MKTTKLLRLIGLDTGKFRWNVLAAVVLLSTKKDYPFKPTIMGKDQVVKEMQIL